MVHEPCTGWFNSCLVWALKMGLKMIPMNYASFDFCCGEEGVVEEDESGLGCICDRWLLRGRV